MQPLSASRIRCVRKQRLSSAQLKEAGFKRIVMMTGDSERTAAAIAKRVGVDELLSAEVLPEDKAALMLRRRRQKATKLS